MKKDELKLGMTGTCRARSHHDSLRGVDDRWHRFRVVETPGGHDVWVLVQVNLGIFDCNPQYFTTWFDIVETTEYDRLVELARQMPEPSQRERDEQRLSFALACSTNHKPSRAAFVALAQSHIGWSADEAEAWAATKTWEVE